MSNEKSKNSLLTFFVGLLLLGAGLYMIANRILISSSFSGVHIGGIRISFGLTTVPFFLGLIWAFVKPDEVIPKIVIVLGVVLIIVAVIMSVRFYFVGTTLYEYILMFGMTAIGSGLLLRTLFAPREKRKNDKE